MTVRCETVSLLNNGALAIPAKLAKSFGERGQFFVENVTREAWYCKYGILNSLIYLPVLYIQKWHEGVLEYMSPTRVIYLNIFNLVVAVASAAYLFLIALRYTKRSIVALVFVLTAFYTTYWWNYLRAQNSEIYQLLFMLGFYYHLVCSADATKPKWQQFFSGLFFSAMILTKVVYVILLPCVGLFLILVQQEKNRDRQPLLSWHCCCSLLPSLCSFGSSVALALGAILSVNNYKFGSPWESGYGQWQERGQPIFSGHLFSGLTHFFFDPQYSIFIYFPLLIFALFGYSTFFKKFRSQTYLFLSIGLVIICVNAKLLAWSGGWAYGPRYLLVMLPLVSLPFLAVLESICHHPKHGKILLAVGVMTLVLLTSFQLQMNVNALPFFVNFRLQGVLASLHDSTIDNYFSRLPFGLINRDLLAFKKGAPLAPLISLEGRLSPETREQLYRFIRLELRSNYYWWPNL